MILHDFQNSRPLSLPWLGLRVLSTELSHAQCNAKLILYRFGEL